MKKTKKSKYETIQDYIRYLELELEHYKEKLSDMELPPDAKEQTGPVKIHRIQPISNHAIFVQFENSDKKGELRYVHMDYEYKKRSRSLQKFAQAFVDIDGRNLCWNIPSVRGPHIFTIPADQLYEMICLQ